PSSSYTVTETWLLASSTSQALSRPVISEPSGEFATQTGVWLSVALVALAISVGSQFCGAVTSGHGLWHTPENWVASLSFSVQVQLLARWQALARSLTLLWTRPLQTAVALAWSAASAGSAHARNCCVALGGSYLMVR